MNNKDLFFARVKPEGKIPSKRDEDAAFDIYACFEEDYMKIEPHETVMVPTGIASAFSDDYVAVIKERGSTGSKGIGQRAGVIDSGYRGEWFIAVTNHNVKPIYILKNEAASIEEDAIIYPYTKAIAQCMMLIVPKLNVSEISYEELTAFKSERGTGKCGSSEK